MHRTTATHIIALKNHLILIFLLTSTEDTCSADGLSQPLSVFVFIYFKFHGVEEEGTIALRLVQGVFSMFQLIVNKCTTYVKDFKFPFEYY
jgi:hypothetical protein